MSPPPYRFHVLGLPHTISIPEYSPCAFTAKVVKLCKMLKMRGHHVVHYGHEASRVVCDEHVTVTTDADLEASYPGHDWQRQGFPPFRLEDPIYATFHANAVAAIQARAQPRDFLLCPFGAGHKPVADAFPDLIVVESGIGYPGGSFARWRVFESYAVMHVYQGMERLGSMSNEMWYDAVIPNAFDLDDFAYSEAKDDFFLFLGRIGAGKGTHIAIETVQRIGGRLVIAGPGSIERTPCVTQIGVIGPVDRREVLSRAKAVFCPSMYLEPFCGVQIEAMLSGTPVISTDWGALAEYNLHGVTGYRCRTMEQFTWAARNIGKISPVSCRLWAQENFSLERIAEMYDEYFWSVAQIYGGAGWYQERADRQNLDWLTKRYPL